MASKTQRQQNGLGNMVPYLDQPHPTHYMTPFSFAIPTRAIYCHLLSFVDALENLAAQRKAQLRMSFLEVETSKKEYALTSNGTIE